MGTVDMCTSPVLVQFPEFFGLLDGARGLFFITKNKCLKIVLTREKSD